VRDLDEFLVRLSSQVNAILLPLIATVNEGIDVVFQTKIDDAPSRLVDGIPHEAISLMGKLLNPLRGCPFLGGLTVGEDGLQSSQFLVVPLVSSFDVFPIQNEGFPRVGDSR